MSQTQPGEQPGQQLPGTATNGGTRARAPRKRRTKAQMTAAKAGAPAARKTPTPEPVVAQRTIAPAPGTPARAVIPNVVVSTYGALKAREAELVNEAAVTAASFSGRLAEVRKMLAAAQPRTASPGRGKATGKRRARGKAKAPAKAA